MNIYSKFSILCGALILTSCSNNEITEVLAPVEGNQTIVLKVSGAKSRAGRELLSSEAGQSIENVKVVITDDKGKIEWVKELNDWTTDEGSLVIDNGRLREIEVPKDEFRMLGGATYYAYSYGYSNGTDYDITPIQNLKVGDQLAGDIVLNINAGVTGEEIFAGNCEIVGDIKGVRVDLVLNRQVAGTYAYLTKIPYVYDLKGNVGSYLILTASNPQSSLVLGKFDNANSAAEYSGYNVVNGQNANTESVIYSIDLSKWFSSIEPAKDEDGRNTGLIKVEDNWIGDATKYKVGSVFAGKFIIPFAKNDASTLQLKLCAADDPATVMRVWNIKLPADAAQLSEHDLFSYADGAWTSVKNTDTDVIYNILRNRLYAIGTKESAVLPGSIPGDPDDPKDEPEPINNKQELNIVLNHSWGVIYTMGVE